MSLNYDMDSYVLYREIFTRISFLNIYKYCVFADDINYF